MSSSRGGHRQRDRSWERDDRDRDRRNRERYESSRGGGRGFGEKRRSSRSCSPHRGDRNRDRDNDRKDLHERDYDNRRHDDRRNRDGDRGRRDDKRRDDRRGTTRGEDKASSNRDEKYSRDVEMKERADSRTESSSHPEPPKGSLASSARPSADPKTPEPIHEDGEAVNDMSKDDGAMMAAMGLAGFGSTKGKHVEGNQEGATNVKKIRTWRQYMNRRGGFNRPLDKIK